MLNLKSFILNEEIKAAHAVKFLDYQDNFHDDVQEDLITLLSKEWKKSAEKLSSSTTPHEGRVEDMKFKNPEPFLGIEFTNEETQIGVGRFTSPKMSPISVKISHAYTAEQRKILIRNLLSVAKGVFEIIILKNKDAFDIKMASGNHKTLFVVKNDADEQAVKLQFKTSEKNNKSEIAKTIFMVGVEHGKEGSKSKHFDRVFFVDFTKK